MRNEAKAAVVAIGAAGAVVSGAVAFAGGNHSEGGVTGPQADRAVRAALEATGGGTASAVERDGETGGTWEVEVATPDGRVVDVRLDGRFQLVAVEGDVESPDGQDAQG